MNTPPFLKTTGATPRPTARLIRSFFILLGALICCQFHLVNQAFALSTAAGYPVSQFSIEYALDHPGHLPTDELLELEVGLREIDGIYAGPRPVDRTERVDLDRLPPGSRFYPSALRHINWWIVRNLNEAGLHGVVVTVPDIEAGTGRDLRPPGDTRLRLRVWTGRIAEIQTVADGARFDDIPEEDLTNLEPHDWIRGESPLLDQGTPELLRVKNLHDYALRVSRHPGRQVAAELEPGRTPGTTRVNYRITEGKPWYVYANYSNTGTEETSEARQSFGFVHNQLSGHDDILRVDYVTGDFDSVHSLTSSYEAPFPGVRDLRWRLLGGWNQYDASEVGFSEAKFHGEGQDVELELRYAIFQQHELFVDLVGGARWQHVEVENELLGTNASEEFLLPRIGVALERSTLTSSLRFSTDLEYNLASLAGTKEENLRLLGRQFPDENFGILRWNGNFSFYLDPMIHGRPWRDTTTPETSTLAHELAMNFRGQYALENRLAPQHRSVAGGFHTVRGYEQAVASGDTAVLGSVEYRFYQSRILNPDPNPLSIPFVGDFHLRPPHAHGRADWDLIYRAFIDFAQLIQSKPLSFEENETLVSIGAGVEFQLLRNLILRADAGLALTDVGAESTAGESRVHFAGTFLY